MKKRIVALALVFVLAFCFAGAAFADSNYGVVNVNTWVNLRKKASMSSTIKAYMKNGTIVDMLDEVAVNGFYKISGPSYTNHDNWTGKAVRSGYGSMVYIRLY